MTDAKRHGLGLLRQLILVRRFEEKCAEMYSLGKIRGFLHLYIGEEAVAVGAMNGLAPEDNVVATYREHGHALLRGTSPEAVMAEMFGKQNGCSRGRGGSMHLFDVEHRLYGGHAIVGGGLPVAVGLALADKLRGRKALTACFFGDGAVDEGEFHESLNLAALWKLPVLFVCENNRYAMGTALERHESVTDLSRKPAAYGISAEHVDGMSVRAVEQAVRRVAERVREEQRPYFLEVMTYRFRAHSMYDAELYRDKAEVEDWKSHHDPIAGFIAELRAEDVLSDAELADIEADVARAVEAAVRAAEEGPLEPVADLLKDVYTEQQGLA
ncbi:MAG: pyruvate dehydrogenase (acetyl-transferring) E1 component subunit alpha [Myxococcales bacterium]|nr:pyruvate dehydrogenase (acetyl-transferring) E1 component subunit alpha [Myxococcales bacterium]